MTNTPAGGERRVLACVVFAVLCIGGFLWLKTPGLAGGLTPRAFAFTPGLLFGGATPPAGLPVVPPPATLVSHLFVHAGWLSLALSLFGLTVFGPRVEAVLGPGRLTLLVALCGIASALAHAVTTTDAAAPLMGMHGALSGVLGAFLFHQPRARIRVPLLLGVVRLPVWLLVAAWIVAQLLLEFGSPARAATVLSVNVAGLVTGTLLAPVLMPALWRMSHARHERTPPAKM